jgi:predicted small secreted protein
MYRNIMLVGVGVGVAATTIFHITVREETHNNRQQLTSVDTEKVSSSNLRDSTDRLHRVGN